MIASISPIPIIIEITGLLASIFTIITFIRWIFEKIRAPYNLGPLKGIILWHYRRRAYGKEGSQKEVKCYQEHIYLDKLYSRNAFKQHVAIKEIVELNDVSWAFSVFVERVGSKPALSSANKDLMMEEIKKLCKKMK